MYNNLKGDFRNFIYNFNKFRSNLINVAEEGLEPPTLGL